MHFSDTLIRQIRAKKSVVCGDLIEVGKIPAVLRDAARENFG